MLVLVLLLAPLLRCWRSLNYKLLISQLVSLNFSLKARSQSVSPVDRTSGQLEAPFVRARINCRPRKTINARAHVRRPRAGPQEARAFVRSFDRTFGNSLGRPLKFAKKFAAAAAASCISRAPKGDTFLLLLVLLLLLLLVLLSAAASITRLVQKPMERVRVICTHNLRALRSGHRASLARRLKAWALATDAAGRCRSSSRHCLRHVQAGRLN